jgi:S1-C subfamily serine protease
MNNNQVMINHQKYTGSLMTQKLLFLLLVLISHVAHSASTGSGFFISSNGYFVTNEHVIQGADSLFIRTIDGQNYPAKLIRTDVANDLAILKVDGKFTPIPILKSSNVNRGAKVVTVGFPHTDVQGLEPKVTEGIINSLAGIRDDPRYFQTSAQLGSGNSGGPLVDSYGNVIGIVAAKLKVDAIYAETGDMVQNVNYAIKSNYLLRLVRTLPAVNKTLPKSNKRKLMNTETLTARIEKAAAIVVNLGVADVQEFNAQNSQQSPPRSAVTPPKIEVAPPSQVGKSTPPVLPTQTPQEFRDCSDCPVMISIPNKNYAISRTEVTQRDWVNIMGTLIDSKYPQQCGLDCPVANLSINSVQDFIEKLNKKTAHTYRLPNIQEWQEACDAGEQNDYCGGNSPKEVGWLWQDDEGESTHPVATKKPNAWGIYDMTGNVLELIDACKNELCFKKMRNGYNVPLALAGGAYTTRPKHFLQNRLNNTLVWHGAGHRQLGSPSIGFRLIRVIEQ